MMTKNREMLYYQMNKKFFMTPGQSEEKKIVRHVCLSAAATSQNLIRWRQF